MNRITLGTASPKLPKRQLPETEPESDPIVHTRCRTLLGLLEQHDPGSLSHAAAVGRVSAWLAWRATGDVALANAVLVAAQYHDVGKLAVANAVLHKPSGLDAGEWRIMRRHAGAGRTLLIACGLPPDHPAVCVAAEHHERFDGGGYPLGLRGVGIRLEARIVALADVFDALLSRRCYKPAWSLPRVVDYLSEQRAAAFDPELVDVLLSAPEQALAVRWGFDGCSANSQESKARFLQGPDDARGLAHACLQAA